MDWAPGSVVAVDAGVHMAGIVKILEEHKASIPRRSKKPEVNGYTNGNGNMAKKLRKDSHTPSTNGTSTSCQNGAHTTGSSKPNPFSTLSLPTRNSRYNAAHILQNLIGTYLITHPHLDHISGFAINSQHFPLPTPSTPPKLVAGHDSIINALQKHVFNDVIWPNLSSESGGVGLFQYERLPRSEPELSIRSERSLDRASLIIDSYEVTHGQCFSLNEHHPPHTPITTQSASHRRASSTRQPHAHPVASSVFFLRTADEEEKPAEVMIWGDVEPDSISMAPRNAPIWAIAAQKIVTSGLRAILIECSYDSTRPVAQLYGHLNTTFLLEELAVLGRAIVMERLKVLQAEGALSPRTSSAVLEATTRKRKRPIEPLDLGNYQFSQRRSLCPDETHPEHLSPLPSPLTTAHATQEPTSYFPPHRPSLPSLALTSPTGLPTPLPSRAPTGLTDEPLDLDSALERYPVLRMPLMGVTVVVTHVKETWAEVSPSSSSSLKFDSEDEDEEQGHGTKKGGDKERILKELEDAVSGSNQLAGGKAQWLHGVRFVMAETGVEVWV